jgi:hydroxyacylglutathione hydrolase
VRKRADYGSGLKGEEIMFFRQVFEPRLAQYTYIVGCQASGEALVIDPMRDIQQYFEIGATEKLKIVAAADTHIHADYISGLREFAERGVKVYASDEGGEEWRYEWLIDSNYSFKLLKDGDSIQIGNIGITAIHTPGHTPEHLIFSITDLGRSAEEPIGYATGDFVFVGDVGRPDLLESAAGMKDVMKPAARTLYRSLESFKRFPEYHRIWPGHGSGSACGKSLGAVPDSTIGYELRYNESLKRADSEENFVEFILKDQPEPPLYFARMKRDNKLGPKVLGCLPQPDWLGVQGLKELAQNRHVVLIDARERAEFIAGHVPGSILSPLDKQFNTTAGCYVEEDGPICLLIEESRVAEAVRDLINVGLDNFAGYATPSDFQEYRKSGGETETLDSTSFDEVDASILRNGMKVLDVRRRSEFEQGRIPGAVNVAHTRLLERLDELLREGKWMVHCSAGGRSAVAAALLRRHGFDVLYVDGDVRKWRERGNPWEK